MRRGAYLQSSRCSASASCSSSTSSGSSSPRSWARATILSVFYLQVSGLLFAVDSVRASAAQVTDLFLVYTSAAFAMLGLRAMFFISDVLGKLFSSLMD